MASNACPSCGSGAPYGKRPFACDDEWHKQKLEQERETMNDALKPRTIFGHEQGPGYMGSPPEIITEPYLSPNEENVVFRLGRFFDGNMQTGWEQIGHVVMTKEEASDFLNKLQALVGLPAAQPLTKTLADAVRALQREARTRRNLAEWKPDGMSADVAEDQRDRAVELEQIAERIGV